MLEQAVRDGSVLLISEQILTEVRRILQQKFPDFEQDFEALLIALGQRIATVPLGAITIGVCRDPDDNHVLETAVLGRAGIIISGDKDLLSLGTYEKISIVTPNTFVTHS